MCPLPSPILDLCGVWGLATYTQRDSRLTSAHLLQPAPVPAWVSMPLLTVVTAVSQLPDLLRHWTPQTLRAWLLSQPRPRGSSLWPGTGSLVRGYHQAFCTEASGRQHHVTAYRHSSHHAHRADITYIHPSQHSTHSADTPHRHHLPSSFANTTNT